MKNLMSRITGLNMPGARQARRLCILITVALLVCWPLPDHAQAAAGDLDPTFGIGGKVMTDFVAGPATFETANDVVIQSDGKIVAAGTGFSSPTSDVDFIVARYNTDGSLDATFGNGGTSQRRSEAY